MNNSSHSKNDESENVHRCCLMLATRERKCTPLSRFVISTKRNKTISSINEQRDRHSTDRENECSCARQCRRQRGNHLSEPRSILTFADWIPSENAQHCLDSLANASFLTQGRARVSLPKPCSGAGVSISPSIATTTIMFSCIFDVSATFVIAFHIASVAARERERESTSMVSVTRDDEMNPMFSYAYDDDDYCARMLIFNLTFVLHDDERMQ